MFKEGKDGFGGGSEWGEGDDVFALEFFLEVGEKLLNFLAVGIFFQNAEGVVIEVFVSPLFGGLEEVVEGEGIGLGVSEEGKTQQEETERTEFQRRFQR